MSTVFPSQISRRVMRTMARPASIPWLDPSAFSLIELLVVIAIVGILAAVTIPAFNAISGAQVVDRGAHDVTGLLEFARSDAVARRTYVWVGVSSTNVQGTQELILAAVYSRDGSGTNTSTSNLLALTKLLRVSNAALTNWTSLKASTQNLFSNGTPDSVSTNIAGIIFDVGNFQFNGQTITFSPRGEALLKGNPGPYDGYNTDIDISFRKANGTVVQAQADDAAVIIDGATGMPSIIQLQ